MAKNTKITKIDRNGQLNTRIEFRGGGVKGEIEVPGGMQEFRAWINDTIREDHAMLIALALKSWLVKNPGSTDFSAVVGKTITLDFNALTVAGIVTIV